MNGKGMRPQLGYNHDAFARNIQDIQGFSWSNPIRSIDNTLDKTPTPPSNPPQGVERNKRSAKPANTKQCDSIDISLPDY